MNRARVARKLRDERIAFWRSVHKELRQLEAWARVGVQHHGWPTTVEQEVYDQVMMRRHPSAWHMAMAKTWMTMNKGFPFKT